MKITLFAVLFAILLLGCDAAGPRFERAELVEDKAMVYVYRPPIFCGGTIAPQIYIDGVKYGSLKEKGYLVYPVDPGKRMIEAKDILMPDTLTLYVDVESGQEYYVRWWFESDGNTYSYSLGLAPSELGLSEIQRNRKSE